MEKINPEYMSVVSSASSMISSDDPKYRDIAMNLLSSDYSKILAFVKVFRLNSPLISDFLYYLRYLGSANYLSSETSPFIHLPMRSRSPLLIYRF